MPCDRCDDTGYVFVPTGKDAGAVAECPCSREAHVAKALKAVGVPESFRCGSLAAYNADIRRDAHQLAAGHAADTLVKKFKDYRKRLLDEPPVGLLLVGPKGDGKTELVSTLLCDMYRAGFDCWFQNMADLYLELRDTMRSKTADEMQRGGLSTEMGIVEHLGEVEFLVLDDMGVGTKPTGYAIDTLYLILNRRATSNVVTVVTSNLDDKDLENHIGTRNASRITEMCRKVYLSNTDYRNPANQKRPVLVDDGKGSTVTRMSAIGNLVTGIAPVIKKGE